MTRIASRVVAVDLQRNRIALTMKTASGDTRPHTDKGSTCRVIGKPAPPPPKQDVFTMPEPGAIAPNGMRFR